MTTDHVERVAESVLQHRRRQHEAPDQAQVSGQQAPSQAQAPNQNDSPSPEGDSDWGYLPPEPTGTTRVKGVIPLNAKKR